MAKKKPSRPSKAVTQQTSREESPEKNSPFPDRTSTEIALAAEIHYSGPLPPAAELQKYDNIEKGLALQIVQDARDSRKERESQQRIITTHVTADNRRGQIFGFCTALAGIAAAVTIIALAPHGKSSHAQWTAGIVAMAALGMIPISRLVFDKRKQRKPH